MILRCSFFVFFVCLFSAPSFLFSGPIDLYQKARELYLAGKYDDTLEPAKKALENPERSSGSDSIEVSKPMTLIADIEQGRKNYPEAAQYLERLWSIQEANFGSRNLKVAETISRLIKVYEKQGNSSKADQMNQLADARWGWGARSNIDRPSSET